MFRIHRFFLTAIVLILPPAASLQAAPEWIEQLGTGEDDESWGISADTFGNVYIAGHTAGALDGPNAGESDAFLAKYDGAGSLQWTKQLGTSSNDESLGVSTDLFGNVYVTGFTDGDLGGPNVGESDVFLSKYDADGVIQWTEQLGTTATDSGHGVSADSLGNVYITGRTRGSLDGPNAGSADAFLAKYDATGAIQWTEQLGTDMLDGSYGVSADSLGNVFITGVTRGSLGGSNAGQLDSFLAMYDATGSLQWIEQIGSDGDDLSVSVSADSLGNVYIAGGTTGSLDQANDDSSYDVFLMRYDTEGNMQWIEQLGSSGNDYSQDVTTDLLGNVYITGSTRNSLGGPNAGIQDAFVAKYDASGSLRWIEQLGSDDGDFGNAISADVFGNIYISGSTAGSLAGPNAGGRDAFVAKFAAPEPATVVLTLCGFAVLVAGSRRRTG